MRRSTPLFALCAITVCFLAQTASVAQDNILRDFRDPPLPARPMTWWHWMNGNISREGITADLEAMKRIGLGGAQIFNVSQGEPAGKVLFMSDEWRQLTKHAISEANRLGLKLAIHNCAGWSESGGPWVTPDQSMQRVVWSETHVRGGSRFSGALEQPATVRGTYHDIAVLAFPALEGETESASGSKRIDDIRAKSGLAANPRLTFSTGEWPADMTIARDRIVDLTSRLQPGGRLDWDAPAGSWTIIRFGHTSTGAQNAPAPDSGRGLECDKMSRAAVEAHFRGMMQKVISDAGPLAGKSLKYVLADSWEAGTQNWTPAFRDEFRKRMGYDLTLWLPILTGRVVGSLDQSERVLWDFRRVIADLIAVNHYSVLRELCAKSGMQLTAEAPGIGMPTIADELQCKGRTDMPMGEFWLDGHNDSKEAATSAHIYGKRRASAEAFTAVTRDAKWMKAPYDHKAIGDLNFCRGINLFVFHRYAMQPWLDRAPGMTMGPWGTNFERTNTWWEQAKAWMQYLSRCQALLQDGRFVADACYYYGEGAPNTIVVERQALTPALPAGYDFDVCDTETLLTRMRVAGGRIVLPDGMSYRVLVLPNSDRMTPHVLAKIRDMAAAGATVVGPRPQRSQSLKEYPACDDEVKRLANEVWGADGGAPSGEHRLGAGRVVWGMTMEQVFAELGTPPDVEAPADARITWIHRRAGDSDLYFVSNQDAFATTSTVVFRVGNRQPEQWEPDTGRIVSLAQYKVMDGRVTVPLHFDPSGSTFVVFRRPVGEVDPIVSLQRNGQDISTAQIITNADTLVIERAIYGVDPDRPERSVDVTRQLAGAVHNGRLRIEADNSLAGDPAPDIVKRLKVVYTLNGEHGETTVDENETVELPARAQLRSQATPDLPSIEATIRLNAPTLRVAEAGAYTVRTASGHTLTVKVDGLPSPRTVSGPWQVQFPPRWGAPDRVTLETLTSWSVNPDEGVRHFSGTATYNKVIDIPADRLASGRALWLDLGTVKEVAEVTVNGKDVGILWKPPFRADITRVAHAGGNQIEIRITNLWPNRLIGDSALPVEKRLTFTTFQPFKPTDRLLESGLLGPVTLLTTQIVAPK